jgi:histidinol-phosphatase (PHP family)
VEKAIKEGFHSLGFSSHAPVPFTNNFSIKNKESLVQYTEMVRHLQQSHQGKLNVFLGLEIDYIPGLMPDFNVFNDICRLDYAIGSVHLVKREGHDKLWFIDGPKPGVYDQGLAESFGNNIRMAVTAYWHQLNRMILEQEFDIIGHIDKIKMHNNGRYFSEDDDWYRKLVFETLELAKERGRIIEVNTRGLYKKRSKDYYPGVWLLKEIKEMGIPITLSSDAHKPGELTGWYREAEVMLKELGFEELMVLTNDGWGVEKLSFEF